MRSLDSFAKRVSKILIGKNWIGFGVFVDPSTGQSTLFGSMDYDGSVFDIDDNRLKKQDREKLLKRFGDQDGLENALIENSKSLLLMKKRLELSLAYVAELERDLMEQMLNDVLSNNQTESDE